MIVSQIDIRPAQDILDAIEDGARLAPGRFKNDVPRYLSRFKSRNLIKIRRQIPPRLTQANYPLRWRSRRQQRFVMKKLRSENNLPYDRSGLLEDSYDIIVRLDNNGGTFLLINTAPHAPFVIGDYQQPFHIDNGWQAIAKQSNELVDELENGLIDTYLTAVDPFAGIPR